MIHSRSFHFLPIALLAVVGLTACSKKGAPVSRPEVVSGVRVFLTASQQVPEAIDVVGTVRANESAILSAQVMGTITNVAVREGDRVRAGQVLLTIDASQLASQVERAHASVLSTGQQIAAAESDAALAASTLNRFEMLKAQKSVSPQEFDEVQSRSKAASARLEMMRSQQTEAKAAEVSARTVLGYTRIRAPFDGIVTERKVDPGTVAAPGIPLLTIEKGGPLRLEVSVDESLLSSVRMGSSIPVAVETLGNSRFDGKVTQIVPVADPASRSFLVKISLPTNDLLRSGMFGHALLPRGTTKNALLISRSAIVTHGSMQSVYVVDPNHIAGLRYISTGSSDGNQIEVTSGLNAGESVIDSPGERELNGKRIEVQQ